MWFGYVPNIISMTLYNYDPTNYCCKALGIMYLYSGKSQLVMTNRHCTDIKYYVAIQVIMVSVEHAP